MCFNLLNILTLFFIVLINIKKGGTKMNKLPQGIVLNEMARKFARKKISPAEYARFESSIIKQLALLEVAGNTEEVAHFLKQSDEFFLLELQTALEKMHDKIEAKLLEGLTPALSPETLAWIKQIFQLYHLSVCKMTTEVVQTIQCS